MIYALKRKLENRSINLGKLGLLVLAQKEFEIMSLDTIGRFGGRKSTKKYLHLLVDHFTRYAFLITSKSQSAKDFIKLLTNTIQENNIHVKTLLTDQYGGIISDEFKNYLCNENITKTYINFCRLPFLLWSQ